MMPADTPEARLIALDERLREKKRHRRRVLVHRIGILASILALLSAGVWLVCFSSFFRFAASRTVLDGVGGDSIVREVDVAQVLEAYEGKPLIFTSMSKLSEDLQGIPEVNHAQAHVRFPRTVVIEVTPQTPAACVGTRDSCTAIADDGSLLRIPEEETKVLPLLILSDSELKNSQAMDVVSQVRKDIDDTILEQISEYSVTASKQLTLTLSSGARVKWGTPSDGEQKNKLLMVLLAEQHDLYDVSIPSAPVTR